MPALYLVRHGEPQITGVMLGRRDPPLSEYGRAQMRALRLPAHVIYSSPLRRARESAELMASQATVIVLGDLTEIALGEWDGLSWAEIEREYPEMAARKLADWTVVTPPGGEPWRVFTARIERALETVRRGPMPAVIVAHSAVNSWIAHRLDGRDPLTFRQEAGAVEIFDLK